MKYLETVNLLLTLTHFMETTEILFKSLAFAFPILLIVVAWKVVPVIIKERGKIRYLKTKSEIESQKSKMDFGRKMALPLTGPEGINQRKQS